MEKLIIRILEDGNFQWALLANGRESLHEEAVSPEQLRAIIPPPKSERIIIALVPGQDVLLKTISVPQAQRRMLHKALPFLVEEQLAEDINDLHIVAGSSEESGQTPVATVRKSLMAHWLHLIGLAGIAPHFMLPETLTLPYQPDEWSLLCSAGTAWLRTGRYRTACIESAMLTPLIKLYSQQELPEPGHLQTMFSDVTGADMVQAIRGFMPGIYPTVEVDVVREAITPLAAFSKGCHDDAETSAINLLRGAFAVRRPERGLQKGWRVAAAIAAGWFLLQLAIDGGESAYLSIQSSSAQAQSLALYHQLFPEDTKIVNPLQQMKSHLSGTNQQPDKSFLALMEHMARYWATSETAPPSQIQSINFKDGPPKLMLNIATTDINTVNALVQRLDGESVHVKLISVVNDKDGVKAQLSLEESAP